MWNWDDWVLFSDQNCIFRANNKDLYGLQWGWKMENISTCLTYSPIRYFLPSYECFDPKSVVLYALLQPAYRISQCSKIIKINAKKPLAQKIIISRAAPCCSKLQQTLCQGRAKRCCTVHSKIYKNRIEQFLFLQIFERTVQHLLALPRSFWQSVRRNFDNLGQFSNDLCDLKLLWKWGSGQKVSCSCKINGGVEVLMFSNMFCYNICISLGWLFMFTNFAKSGNDEVVISMKKKSLSNQKHKPLVF